MPHPRSLLAPLRCSRRGGGSFTELLARRRWDLPSSRTTLVRAPRPQTPVEPHARGCRLGVRLCMWFRRRLLQRRRPPTTRYFRGSISRPTDLLSTLRRRPRGCSTTQDSLPVAGPRRLPGQDFHLRVVTKGFESLLSPPFPSFARRNEDTPLGVWSFSWGRVFSRKREWCWCPHSRRCAPRSPPNRARTGAGRGTRETAASGRRPPSARSGGDRRNQHRRRRGAIRTGRLERP